MKRLRWLVDRGGVLAVLAFVVYVLAASPAIVGNDSAEMSTLGATGGVAHPSGYPGYILWLRAWSWLPGTAAWSASLATAVLGVLAVVALHGACRAWGASPGAATVTSALYATAPIVVRYVSEADVFAGNQLVVALVLWLAGRAGPLRGVRRAFALGLVAGLGMTNNLTCTLAAPIGLVGVWFAWCERDRQRWRALAAAAGGWALGMLPYAYVFVAPQNALSWPNPTSVSELLDLILRRTYGSFSLVGTGHDAPLGAHLAYLAGTVARAWWWVLPVAGLAALAVRCARPGRLPWLALAATLVITGPIVMLGFDVEPVDLGAQLVHRFHLMPLLLLAIPIAAALTWCEERVARDRALRVAVLGHGVLIAGAALALVDVARFHTPAMENEVRNTLRSLPQRSVIMTRVADELDVGVRYLQLTEHERTDVIYVRYPDLVVPWYAAKVGVAPAPARDLVERFHAEGRAVFINWWEEELRARFPSYTFGILVRLLPVGSPVPSLPDQFAQNRALFESFDLAYPAPGKHDDFATWVHRRYAGTWGRLATELSAAGHAELAATAIEIGKALQPQD